MHFRAGSSECWQWGRPLGESWEHSPEQGNLGRKTKVLGGSDTHRSSLSTATTSTFASEAAPPNALLATGPLPAPLPPPQVCGTCRACVPRFQQRGTTSAPSLRRRTPIPSHASLNRPSAPPCSSCPLSTSQPSPSSFVRLLHPINHAVLKALPWRPVACSPGSSPVDATGRPHNPPQLAGSPLLYVKVIFRMFKERVCRG